MKNLLVLFLSVILFASCDKDSPGDGYDFSNSIPQFVTLSTSGEMEVFEGDEVDVTFAVRSAFQQKVTIYYKISGAVTVAEQSVVLERNKTSVTTTIPIPDGLVTDPGTTVEAQLTLTKATKENGDSLTIGQLNDPENQVLTLIIGED